VTDVHEADVCKVIPTKFSGGKEVVPLQMRKLVSVPGVRDRRKPGFSSTVRVII
jgi:hypothetical protein